MIFSTLGKGNLVFCCMGSQDNYFGLVSRQNNKTIFGLKVGTSKNKNIDHRSRETSDNESNLISSLHDSTMSSVLNFCFLYTSLQPKRKINGKRKNVYM